MMRLNKKNKKETTPEQINPGGCAKVSNLKATVTIEIGNWISSNKKVLQLAAVLINGALIIFLIIIWNRHLQIGKVNNDAGYYLSVVERLYEGMIPYRDFSLGYTPLSFYILLSAKCFFRETSFFTHYLSVTILFEGFSVLLVFLISRQILKNIHVRIFTALLVFFQFYLHEGGFISLEPFVIFFSLAGVYFVILGYRSHPYFVLSGFCISMSYLSKQYGLAVLLPISFYILFLDKNSNGWRKIKNILFVCLGSVIPLIAFYYYFIIINGIPIEQIFTTVSGKEYGMRSLSKYYYALFDFVCFDTPFLLLLPIFLWQKLKKIEAIFWIFAISFFSFSLPLYFKQYGHYLLMIAPFSVLIGLYCYNYYYNEWCNGSKIAIFFMLFISLSFIYIPVKTIRLFYINEKSKDIRFHQLYIAKKINKTIDQKTAVAMIGSEEYWYLSNLYPPNIKSYGYSFLTGMDKDTLSKQLYQSDYAITNEVKLNGIKNRNKNPIDIEKLLIQQNYRPYEKLDDKLLIWRNSNK